MDYNIDNPFRAYVSLSDSIRKTIDEPEAQGALTQFLNRANYGDNVFCELGRPEPQQHQSQVDYFQRLMYVDENKVVAKVVKASYDAHKGCIVADMIPFGPYREAFNCLLRPESSVSFSIRAFTSKGMLSNIATIDMIPKQEEAPVKRDFIKGWMRG